MHLAYLFPSLLSHSRIYVDIDQLINCPLNRDEDSNALVSLQNPCTWCFNILKPQIIIAAYS